jgi:hypothetical protein
MRWRSYLLISVILLLSCAPVFAETISVSSSSEWLTANNRDTAVITVTVKDSYENPIEGLTVDYSVNESPSDIYYGSFSHPTKTDENGISTATFKSSIIAGTANISVSVTSVNGTFRNYTIVKIDHDTPFSMQFISYPNNATVGTTQNISVRLQDIHGNIVDNQRNTEYITFTIITMDDSRLWNFSSSSFTNKSTTIGNNQTGWIIPNITLDTRPGDTLIRIKPNDNIADRTIKIERVADGEPYLIYAVRRDPSVPFVPANGKDYFVITYQLFDQYGNVLNNKEINLEAAPPGEPWYPNITTTYEGIAAEQYGPFPIEGQPGRGKEFSTNLIAVAKDNHSVRVELPVEFYDPTPVKLLLSVNPKNLPSLDVNETSKAIITAAVIDSHGKGVQNQTVYFDITSIQYSPGNAKWNESPWISATSAKTGESGFAYITFIPGEFNENEIRSVTGNCTVTGSWNGTTKTAIPLWKNYGYLKVTTWVDNNNIVENQEVNVGVEVYADGPSFTSRPIDMIFNLDRGAKMLLDTYNAGASGPVQDKMVYVYEYSGVLLEELIECSEDEQCDRAGVVSFGPGFNSTNWPDKLPGDDTMDKYKVGSVWHDEDAEYRAIWYPGQDIGYEDFATIDTGLVYDFDPSVGEVVNDTKPFGDPWKGDKQNVPMRYGLYKAINEMIGLGESNPRPNAIRAIILLSDTEWNDWGDPSAGWDGISVKTENAVPLSKKAAWDLPQGGISAWTPFDSFGEYVDGNITAVPAGISDPRQNMANYAKAHDIIIYSVAYPEKDTNIETSRERVMRDLADTTGGMYFEARSGTNLKTIFEIISRDLRQRASVNTTAEFNFSNVRLNGTPDFPGIEAFNYTFITDRSTITQKWNESGDLLYREQRNDTENWTTSQKLTFDLGTMFIGDRWQANFTLISKKVGTVELFENSYVFSDDEQIAVPQPIIQTGGTRRGDVPSSTLEITYFNVTDSMNAVYTITYSGTDTVHARLYYRKAGDVQGDWKQFAARNYQCKDGECNGFTDEALMNKWLLASGQYMFKIEAWASDAPLDDAYDGPKGIGNRYFIWLR